MLRIISGERRGAKLQTPPGEETRPLRDRVRESLFNILRPQIPGKRILDAFAGSGAVGLEALSNGAAHAVFVDPSPASIQAINANVKKLRYEDRTIVIRGKSPASVERSPSLREPFGMMFLMPPYHSGLCIDVLSSARLYALCTPECLAVCEIHAKEEFEAPDGWAQDDERLYGITRLVFLRRNG